ncbi:MAG: hypothetical protein QOI22_399 [Verrucomicrobiota bacterium]|jgi:uncharacterized membrane protein YkvA (DUF1232 family)
MLSLPGMKKAKVKKKPGTKQRATKTVVKQAPYQKAALRSQAFARAILDAKSYVIDPASLRALFEEASRKAATIPKEPFKDSWPYLQAMLRLIRAYFRGEYRNISQNALLSIIAAVSYLVNPFDLIPDEIPFLGFVDDATVIAFAVEQSRGALDDFMTWETTAF